MLPFELVATATDSPRYSPAGSFRKFGTDEKGISGTPVIVAFCWADAEPARSTTAAQVERRCRVMEGSLYQGPVHFNRPCEWTCHSIGTAWIATKTRKHEEHLLLRGFVPSWPLELPLRVRQIADRSG